MASPRPVPLNLRRGGTAFHLHEFLEQTADLVFREMPMPESITSTRILSHTFLSAVPPGHYLGVDENITLVG